jgi:hypothetical protein
MDDYNSDIKSINDRLNTHIKKYEDDKAEELDRHREVLSLIVRLSESVDSLASSTNGLVAAWNAGSGVVKVATLFGRFVLWVSVTSAALAGALHWLGMEFPKR